MNYGLIQLVVAPHTIFVGLSLLTTNRLTCTINTFLTPKLENYILPMNIRHGIYSLFSGIHDIALFKQAHDSKNV